MLYLSLFCVLALYVYARGVHLCSAGGWAPATANGGEWVEFQFAEDIGEIRIYHMTFFIYNIQYSSFVVHHNSIETHVILMHN